MDWGGGLPVDTIGGEDCARTDDEGDGDHGLWDPGWCGFDVEEG